MTNVKKMAGLFALLVTATALAVPPGVVFIDQMNSLDNWKADGTTKLAIVKTERKTGESSMFVRYIIDKDNPGTVWFARTNIGIDRAPSALQVFVNIPQSQRFTWYDFPKLRMVIQDKDGTAVYVDIDKFAARPVYEGGKSYYVPWAQVYLKKDLFYPLWPGRNGKLDGIETISFELPHRTEDFMKDGEFTMYLDELAAIFDNAEASVNETITELRKKNTEYEKELASLPKGTWQRYPEALMGVIELFCTNALDEFKEGKPVRTARELGYLQELSNQIAQGLAEVKKGNNPWKDVTKAKYVGLTVKNGTYHDANGPVFITGFCGSVGAGEMKEFNRMGFNGFSSGCGPISTRPEEKKEVVPANIVAEAKMASENNLAYDILFSPHDTPGWALAKWPDIDPSARRRGAAPDQPLSPKNQYMPWNVDHPEFRKILADHARIMSTALKGNPALASYDLCNEMWYLCHGDFDPSAFRARLQQRYQTIAALNKAWGTQFADFKDVQFQANSETSTADLYEYNQYRVTEFFRWYTAELRKHDDKHPIYGKVHGCWRQMIGINKAELTKFFTAADSDVYPRIGNDEENLIADMWTAAMVTQEYRSLAPDKPQIDSEQHMIWYHQIVTYDFIRSLLWWRAILGLDANYAWVWSRTCENIEECIFTQPWAFNALSQFALDVERLAVPVDQFQQVKPDVLLIEAGDKTPYAYKLCAFTGYAFDLLPREALTPDVLKGYKTILLPPGAKVDDGLKKVITGANARVVWMTDDMKLKDVKKKIHSAAAEPPVQAQYGLVNFTAVDASGKPMIFLLNLNVEKVTAGISVPRRTTATNLLTGRPIVGTTLDLEPLKPVIVVLK
jgi:hypothetical protein